MPHPGSPRAWIHVNRFRAPVWIMEGYTTLFAEATAQDRDARVLAVVSEGATDPASYRRIVGADP